MLARIYDQTAHIDFAQLRFKEDILKNNRLYALHNDNQATLDFPDLDPEVLPQKKRLLINFASSYGQFVLGSNYFRQINPKPFQQLKLSEDEMLTIAKHFFDAGELKEGVCFKNDDDHEDRQWFFEDRNIAQLFNEEQRKEWERNGAKFRYFNIQKSGLIFQINAFPSIKSYPRLVEEVKPAMNLTIAIYREILKILPCYGSLKHAEVTEIPLLEEEKYLHPLRNMTALLKQVFEAQEQEEEEEVMRPIKLAELALLKKHLFQYASQFENATLYAEELTKHFPGIGAPIHVTPNEPNREMA